MQNLPGPARDLPEPTLDSAVRALLAAIVDALTVPHGDQADDDLAEYALLRRRTDEARIIAASVLPDMDARYIADAAEQLRGWTAEGPVTYRTWRNPATQTADAQLHAEGGEGQ